MPVIDNISYLPSDTSLLPQGSWLIIASHPYDEILGMGGALLLAKSQGTVVDVVFVASESEKNTPKKDTIEKTAITDKLNIRNTYFWYENNENIKPSTNLVTKLSKLIKKWQPTAVFFPSPLEPESDHRATAVLTWESLRLVNFIATPISYDISTQGNTNHLVDITTVINDKRALIKGSEDSAKAAHCDRVIALNKARTWSLPHSVIYAESFYVWPKENRSLNALVLDLATKASSLHALPHIFPLISVITRTKNRPDFLREAIRSVAGQTYPNIELVVVNDGGENCSSLVQEEATGAIKQFHYEHLASNIGRSAAANVGLKFSQGKFIIFLDDDDFFETYHISSLYEHLKSHKEAIAAYSAVRCINEKNETVHIFEEEYDPIQLCIGNFIPIHSLLFNSDALTKGCLFDEDLVFCEDWDFWIQLQQQGHFSFSPSITATYRLHPIGSGLWNDQEKSRSATLKIYKKWLPLWKDETLLELFEYAHYKKKSVEKDTTIAEQIKILADKDCTIAEQVELSITQTSKIADQEKKLLNKSNTITEQGNTITEQARILSDKENMIREKKEILSNQNEELIRTKNASSNKQTSLDAQLADANSTITFLKQEKRLIYASTSWKITKPFRFIKTFAGRNKKVIRKTIRLLKPPTPPIENAEKQTISTPINDTHTRTYINEYNSKLNAAINSTPIDYVPLAGDHIDQSRSSVKVIAFYLPQFHPVPVNNKEWGRGFTEWTNVSKAVPQFSDHYQPRLPGELGYYDLRLKEVQQRQIELAKQYGIDGFCYHHYWFGGTKVLEKPFQQILDDPSLDLPFCLCWANENWTRRWDGGEDEIILEQHHSAEDDLAFIADIEPALKDKRYIRINNKPLLIVYRPSLLPDPAATAIRWRKYAREAGIGDLHIVSAATFGFEDFESINYDGLVQFPPHNIAASNITTKITLLNQQYQGNVFDYKEFSQNAITALKGHKHTFPCVMMNWDNEARKPEKGHTFHGATPESYKEWLNHSFNFVKENNPAEEQVVFINAWNEWAEGTYLEPDRRYGYAYLHATANIIRDHYNVPNLEDVVKHNTHFTKTSNTAIVIHLYYPELIDDLLNYIDASNQVDYFINLPRHIDTAVIKKLCSSARNTYITLSPNKGRDILPFITILDKISTLGYDYLLKIHSKKTMYRKDGAEIRENLFHELMGKLSVQEILKHFEINNKLGLIAPTGSIMSLSKSVYLINNKTHINDLLARSGNAMESLEFDFIAGSMFWARVKAIKPILDLQLNNDDFETELGQLDGTMAHAVERIFSFLANQNGYQTITLNSLNDK